jgi:hypothetical protein
MGGILGIFFGAGGGGIVSPLPGGTFSGTTAGSTATVGMTFTTAGDVNRDFGGSTFQHRWYNPNTTGIGSNFWIRVTLSSGTTPTGSLNSWLQLSTNRSWSVARPTVGTNTSVLAVSIATDAIGANIVATGSYTLSATRSS